MIGGMFGRGGTEGASRIDLKKWFRLYGKARQEKRKG